MTSKFADQVRIEVRGGAGGAGIAAFQKRKGKPRGRPTGGTGGRGGDVILEADPGLASLLRYERRPHWKAGDGSHAEGELRHGRTGEDVVLSVPLGTVVYDDEDTMLADLVTARQRLTVARGGKGGRGNAAFVTTERRAPSFSEQGEFGEARRVTLELRLLADAALIGFPNAGKSTLIARVSAAKPKIADYPFTTLEPNLGIVTVDDREFVFADIPGLIEGAAEGKGLGHEFLRHTERARALVMLLDPSPLQDTTSQQQHDILSSELVKHSPELGAMPRIVALNKIDGLVDVRDHLWWAQDRGIDLLPVSAVTGAGIDGLLHAVADLVDEAERAAPEREGFVLHRPLGESFAVTRIGSEWVVTGRSAERAVNLDDLTVPEAADLVARRLVAIGVDEALRSAGASSGDDVRIGGLVFTFDPDAAGEEDA